MPRFLVVPCFCRVYPDAPGLSASRAACEAARDGFTRLVYATGQRGGGMVRTILQRISDGDRSAVPDCLDAYGGLVWGLALRYLRSHTDAEDATQDIFLSIWTSAWRFDPDKGSEPSFVATIAHRRLIDLKRSARIRATIPLDGLSEPETDSAAAKGRWGAEVGAMRDAMASLPDGEREALQLAVRYGLSHAQIAAVTEQPIGTIKTRLRRAMQRLRESAPHARQGVASVEGGGG